MKQEVNASSQYRILYMGSYVAGADYLKTGESVLACLSGYNSGEPGGYGVSVMLSSNHLRDGVMWTNGNFEVRWNKSAGTITCTNSGYPCSFVIVFGT